MYPTNLRDFSVSTIILIKQRYLYFVIELSLKYLWSNVQLVFCGCKKVTTFKCNLSLALTTYKAPTMSALSTHLCCVRGLSLPQSALEVCKTLSSLSENLTMWRTICSSNKPATYRLLSHRLALVTSLSWNKSPAHFKLHIILSSDFFYSHLHVALSPWRDLSTLFSSSSGS